MAWVVREYPDTVFIFENKPIYENKDGKYYVLNGWYEEIPKNIIPYLTFENKILKCYEEPVEI